MIEFHKLPKELQEISAFELSDRKIDLKEGEFSGLASAFDTRVESFIPTILKQGAFKETLEKNAKRVKVLWQHNPEEPIGVPIEMKENSNGLQFTGKLSLGTQRGREALELMRDGVINAMSIGWTPTSFRFEEKNNETIRIVEALELFEVSLVTFPANPKAKIKQVSSHSEAVTLEQIKSIVDDSVRAALKAKDAQDAEAMNLARISARGKDLLILLEELTA